MDLGIKAIVCNQPNWNLKKCKCGPAVCPVVYNQNVM